MEPTIGTLDVITPQEAAVILRCHYRTVLDLIRQGKLRASRFGTQSYRIERSALAECMKTTEVPVQDPNTQKRDKVATEVATEPLLAETSIVPTGRKVPPRRRGKVLVENDNRPWYERLTSK